MSRPYFRFLFLFSLVIITASNLSAKQSICNKPAPIHWGKSYIDKDVHCIPGKIEQNRQTLSITWRVGPGVPPFLIREKREQKPVEKLFLLDEVDGATLIFSQSIGTEESVLIKLRLLSTVQSKVLYKPLRQKKVEKPPLYKENVVPISWENAADKGDVKYIPGVVQANFGNFRFYWKKSPKASPQLFFKESWGGGQLPKIEIPLLICEDDAKGLATLYREKIPLNNSDNQPAKLRPLVTVRTADLYSVIP